MVADALSRVDIAALKLPGVEQIDFPTIAKHQLQDTGYQGTSLHLKKTNIPYTDISLLCDFSTGTARPYIPPAFRMKIFDALHGLSHSGIQATQKLIYTRFVWPKMNTNIRKWSRSCITCQKSKVHRHTITPFAKFPPVTGRFEHVHLDLVGPFPHSNGFTYLLTCVDRFTRWPEAAPIPDMTAATVTQAFVTG